MPIIAGAFIGNGPVAAVSLITVTFLHPSVIDSRPPGASTGAGLHQDSPDF